MNTIFFSIIIPIYNVEKYLPECIDSVINQRYSSFEVILVDDGSPDCCPQICDEYAKKDSRIKVIHKKNGGLSDARNTGLRHAKGDYILFLDSDDFYVNNNFLSIISQQCQISFPDIILFRRTYCNEEGKQNKKFTSFPILEKYNSNSFELMRALAYKNLLEENASMKVIKKKILLENNIIFKIGIYSEDVEWFLRLMPYIQKIEICNVQNYMYRVRSGSITQTIGEKNISDLLTTIEEISCQWKEVKDSNIKSIICDKLSYQFFIVLGLLSRLERAERKSYFLRLKKISWIREYCFSKKNKKANVVLKFFGYRLTSQILGLYIKTK